MRKLEIIEMIEHARTFGVANTKTNLNRDPELTEKFFNTIKRNNILIFNVENEMTVDANPIAQDTMFDSPFDVVSIEMSTGFICSPKMTINGVKGKDEVYIRCILLDDSDRGMFIFALPGYHKEYGKYYQPQIVHMNLYEEREAHNAMAAIVHALLNRLNTQKVGREFVSEKVKIKASKGNEFVKISQVIHISGSKKYFKELNEGEKRNIEFSHRFFRRGHWRLLKPEQIGKDRAEQRVAKGRTWVIESEVGNKDLPLINKVRVVLDSIKDVRDE